MALNANPPLVFVCSLASACLPALPDGWASGEAQTSSDEVPSAADTWPSIDPPGPHPDDGPDDAPDDGPGADDAPGSADGPGSAEAEAGESRGDTAGDSDSGEDPPADLPAAIDPFRLEILGVAFDPPGRDGAPEGPEWIWLRNADTRDLPWALLEIESRDWPGVDAQRLQLGEGLWPAGAELVIERYEAGASLPAPVLSGARLRVSFAHASGLRNSAGAAAVGDGSGEFADVVSWGDTPSEAPYVGVGRWEGPPVESSQGAVCREPQSPDLDDASGWIECPPLAP